MSDFDVIFEWLKSNCPPLYELWVISSMLEDRRNVIQPKSSENMYQVDYTPYANGGARYIFKPTEPYFFDIDIICFRAFYEDQNEYNMDTLDSVQAVCDWMLGQQNNGSVPQFEEYPCYQIECLTPKPFIRGVYEWDGTPDGVMVDYAVTVRFYTKNPAKQRVVLQ